jgi:hypothetical protein
VLLVHWHEAEAQARAAKLVAMGHDVAVHWRQDAGGELTRGLAAAPPEAVVIDLSRLPSHGRAVATWLRERKALRQVPLVFVPGDEEKTARLRQTFSDAAFVPWSRMKSGLARAIARPPQEPVVPRAAEYSGTPLGKKLGIAADARVALVRAPQGLVEALGVLPDGVTIVDRLRGELQVVVLFCRSLAELEGDWSFAERCLAERGGLWVAWPKQASGILTDLRDGVVRAFGLDRGLVDNKVCAIDADWSALRFARRKAASRR